MRRQTEQFHPVDGSDWARLRRADNGYTLGQLYPERQPGGRAAQGDLQRAVAGGAEQPNLTFENRLVGDGGTAWVFSFRDNLTWIRGSHTFKGGRLRRAARNTEGPGGVGAGPWAGQFNFTRDTRQPARHALRLLERAARRLPRLHRGRRAARGAGPPRSWRSGTSRTPGRRSRRLTLDYGIRFLWYKPWSTACPRRRSCPSGTTRRGRRGSTSRRGSTTRTWRSTRSPGRSCRTSTWAASCPAPATPQRDGASTTTRTTRRASATTRASTPSRASASPTTSPATARPRSTPARGLYHNAHITARSMDQAANNPPAVNQPIVYYGTMDTLLGGRPASEPSEQRLRPRARREDAEQLQLVARRPARDRLGHGRGPDLRRQRHAPPGAGAEHQRGAGRREVRRPNPQNANPRNPARSRTRSCGPTSATRTSRSAATTARRTTTPPGPAQPPLHPRLPVRRRLHVRQGARRGRRRRAAGERGAAAEGVALRPARGHADPQPRHQLHLGPPEGEQALATTASCGSSSTTGSSRARTRSRAATGRPSS